MAVLGNNSIGGSTTTLEDYIVGSEFTTGDNGAGYRVDDIYCYHNPSSNAFTTKCAIYKGSDGTLVAQTNVVQGTGASWKQYTFATKPTLLPATAYILVAWCQARSGTNVVSYGSGAANQGHYANVTYGASFPDPQSFTHDTKLVSIYANVESLVATSFTGGGTVSVSGSATMQYAVATQNIVLAGSGQVSVSGAAGLEFHRNASIVGSGGASISGSGTPTYNRNVVLAGSGSAVVSGTATIVYTTTKYGFRSWDFDIGVNAAVTTSSYSLTGSGTVSITGSATLAYNRHYVLAGAGSVTISGSATLQVNRQYKLVGSGSVSVSGTATMEFSGKQHISLTGSGVVSIGGGATIQYHAAQHRTMIGSGTILVSGAASMDYTFSRSLSGFVQITISGSAIMQYYAPPVVRGRTSRTGGLLRMGRML